MPYTYGTKGSPTVGRGTPGLPRRQLYDRFDMTWAIPGTYTWVVPDDFPFDSVCAVAVGAGGSGALTSGRASSGGGGALAWANNINVTPGQSITVVVGEAAGLVTTVGGTSYFMGADVCAASGGERGGNGVAANGGTVLAGSGGAGGAGALATAAARAGSSGGGAGGYSGNGANGVTSLVANLAGNAGSGGSAGSGGISAGILPNASGGVGVFGEGASGTAGSTVTGGGGGSGGSDGAFVSQTNQICRPGSFGAGGASALDAALLLFMWPGSSGCVRIIAGTGRAFPSTDTGQ